MVILSIIPVIFCSKQVLCQSMIHNKYTLAKKKGNNSQIVDNLSDGTKIVALYVPILVNTTNIGN